MNQECEWRGLSRSSQPQHITYEKADQLIAGFEPKIRAIAPDIIVGIARSGVVLASMIAQRIGAEFYCMRCQRHDSSPRWIDAPKVTSGVALLVDDFVSRGDTMLKSKQFLEQMGFTVKTLSLFYDIARTQFVPDVSHATARFIRFAWERRESTNAALENYAKSDSLLPELEQEAIAIDLDGILTSHDQQTQPLQHQPVPDIDYDKVTIITSRPNSDFAKTQRWLIQHGYGHVPLICRNENLYGNSPQDIAAHKAKLIAQLGISIYFESELLQATLIAQAVPTSEIIWWGQERHLRIGGVSTAGWQAR
jgi:hypoxanthine phosphoribosyltransferase